MKPSEVVTKRAKIYDPAKQWMMILPFVVLILGVVAAVVWGAGTWFWPSLGWYFLGLPMLGSYEVWAVHRAMQHPPRSVLFLRPFEAPGVREGVREVMRRYGPRFGLVFTLADSTFSKDALTRVEVQQRSDLKRLTKMTAGHFSVSWTWVTSFDELVVISAADLLWQDVVKHLLERVDLVIMDLSEAGSGSAWELDQLVDHGGPVLCIAHEKRHAAATALSGGFLSARSAEVCAYGNDGEFLNWERTLTQLDRAFDVALPERPPAAPSRLVSL